MDVERDAAAAGRSMAGTGVSAGVAEARAGNPGDRRAMTCVIGEPRKEAGRGGMTCMWRGRGGCGA